MNINNQKRETKEDFCGACVMIPLAMAGAGITGYGTKKGAYGKQKKLIMRISLIFTIVTALIAIFYLRNCKSCR